MHHYGTQDWLIEEVAQRAGLTKSDARKALKALSETVTSGLRQGYRIKISGLGTFEVAARKARVGRNPSTGEAIKISATKVPKFHAEKALKSTLGRAKKSSVS